MPKDEGHMKNKEPWYSANIYYGALNFKLIGISVV